MSIDLVEQNAFARINEVKQIVGKEHVITGEFLRDRYSHIWTMGEGLRVKAVILPKTTEEISLICKLCYEEAQPILVYGGLTNLVGATRPNGDEVVISLERLNEIEDVNIDSKTMLVQAGVILENIHEKAAEYNLMFPLSFGAKGSAQIGGCISTNAGGVHVLKFGMTRNLVLGIEAVLPDGTIINSLKEIVKDNTGIDLKQLFIGTEGILGIVTRATLSLYEAPKKLTAVYVAIDSFENVLNFKRLLQASFGSRLSAFELMFKNVYQELTGEHTVWKPPIEYGANYYMLFELMEESSIISDNTELENFLEDCFVKNVITNATFSYSNSEFKMFWNIREDVSILSDRHPYSQHFDISIPVGEMDTYLHETKAKLLEVDGVEDCFVFGHLADGNMHFVVGKTSEDQELKDEINDIVYTPIRSLHGSISAEHGIGLDKKKYLPLSRSVEEISLMQKIKSVIDDKGILNPGRVL